MRLERYHQNLTMRRYLFMLLVSLLAVGCGGGDKSFPVIVRFPDSETKYQAKLVRLVVVIPGAGAGCEDLKAGAATPGEGEYVIEDQVSFQVPVPGDVRSLRVARSGRRLFYGEAEDDTGWIFLRGCAVVEVGAEDSELVVITLERIGQPCTSDADCDDQNDCTSDSCPRGVCVFDPVAEGVGCGVCLACDGMGACVEDLDQDQDCPICQECGPAGACLYQAAGVDVKGDCLDALFCNGVEACDGSGGCQPGDDPCPNLNCNEDNDTCEGCQTDAECQDDQFCNGLETCDSGTCMPGSDPCPGTQCNSCQEDLDSCFDPDGTACDDGDDCASQDACDGSGVCVAGPTDKDTDEDGYYDQQCPGGDDCDDGALLINPGAAEGSVGDASCSDLADNDCDGFTDDLDPGCSDWWDAAFRSRVRLGFDNSACPEDLQDFPVRVSLDATRVDYSRTRDLGQDLRFVDADGATVLAHEIEIWDEAGTSEMWVRVPQIDASSTSDFIWMYFDNAAAADGQNPSLVWDPDHVAVFHLGEPDAGGAVSDSSSSANDGTVFNGAIFESVGKIGRAIAFDGIDDYASLGNTGFNPAAGTVELWIKIDAFPALDRSYVFSHFTPSPTANRAYIHFQPDQLWGTGMGSAFDLVTGSALTAGDWIYLVLTWDGTDARGYRDGALDFGPTPYADMTAVGDIRAMSWDGVDELADGTLDELRISRTSRSQHWISAQHSSMMDAFVVFGAVQAAP
jgi:hypothetical protein